MANITKCRICESKRLIKTIDLGRLSLSGKFFKKSKTVPKKNISLVVCKDCGLNQLYQVIPILHF